MSPFMIGKWYRFQLTSALSIVHRFTGIGLSVGSILLTWWLISIAMGGEAFSSTRVVLSSPAGRALLFLWSAAFFYHLCNGVRHLAWDAGHGFDLRSAYRGGYIVVCTATLLTVLSWIYVLVA
ncbi:MAG: succinate dehydrogenase, cytochrome b556 subunit [Sinobacteraceae bacterium]|nr:succinate dehydrogenase, cytochrome b556 subunit [Nevskiaceae bacterium]